MLERSRERFFVGRRRELDALEAFLADDRRRLFYLQGMGGIGKTQLLHALTRRAREGGWEVTSIDGRDFTPTAEAIGAALLGAGARDRARLIVVDTFEVLSAFERPLREQVLPQMPVSWRVVFAGRERLDPTWTADPGWSELLEIHELGELSDGEAREYLELREVEPARIPEILELAGGLPLALSMASETAGSSATGQLEDDPDLIEGLLRLAIDRAPSPAHYRALATSALVCHTTEEVLESTAGGAAAALFDWLALRPFFQTDTRGIRPHDLVRHALLRRIRWRQPDLFADLLVAAGEYHLRRLRRQLGSDAAAETVRQIQFFFGHGDLSGNGPLTVDGYYRRAVELRPSNWPLVDEIVADQAGPEAVAHLHAWRDHPAFEILGVRRGAGDLEGFFCGVQAHLLAPDEARLVPGIGIFADHFGPLARPAPYVWMWGDRRAGHEVSATQTCAMGWITDQILARSETEHSAFAVREGLDWIHSGVARTSPKPVPECTFQLGSARYVVLNKTHVEPPLEWLAEMTEEWLEMLRGTGSCRSPGDVGARPPSAGALLDALKAALKQADRPDLLGDSALLELEALAGRTAGARTTLERGRVLADSLRELARDTLRSPRDELAFDILHRTYFEPSAKQRVIAAELGLGYSTYRRHLATTIERLADALLQWELGARSRPGDGT